MTNETFTQRRTLLTFAGYSALITPQIISQSASAATSDVDEPGEIEQIPDASELKFIGRAFELRQHAIDTGDQGYGALVVRDKIIIGQAPSEVVINGDPSAHAEMQAIRDAARRSASRNLAGSILYSSSRPCPMCEAAAYWAGIETMIYGESATDGGRPALCR